MARPIRTVRRVHKRTKKFIRHQSDRYKKIKVSLASAEECIVLIPIVCVCRSISPIGENPRVLTTG